MLSLNRQWYVVSTKSRREQFATAELRRREVETFLPRIIEPGYGTVRPTIAPLFPGYLFVRIDLEQEFCRVVWTPGVRKFIGFGTLPQAVDDAVVDFLRARGGVEGIVRAVRTFKQGDVVRVTRGPLAGLVGIIENPVCGRGRVQVLLELLRRQTRVELPPQLIERVSA